MAKFGVNKNQLLMIQKTISDLKRITAKELSNELATTAALSVKRAKEYVPVDTGNLKQSIRFERINEKNIAIIAGMKYAPYIEFGTGRGVTMNWLKRVGIPESYASQFKGSGKKQVNVYARPFFFPAISKEIDELDTRLNKMIDKISK